MCAEPASGVEVSKIALSRASSTLCVYVTRAPLCWDAGTNLQEFCEVMT